MKTTSGLMLLRWNCVCMYLDNVVASVPDSVENELQELLERLFLFVCTRSWVEFHAFLRHINFSEEGERIVTGNSCWNFGIVQLGTHKKRFLMADKIELKIRMEYELARWLEIICFINESVQLRDALSGSNCVASETRRNVFLQKIRDKTGTKTEFFVLLQKTFVFDPYLGGAVVGPCSHWSPRSFSTKRSEYSILSFWLSEQSRAVPWTHSFAAGILLLQETDRLAFASKN